MTTTVNTKALLVLMGILLAVLFYQFWSSPGWLTLGDMLIVAAMLFWFGVESKDQVWNIMKILDDLAHSQIGIMLKLPTATDMVYYMGKPGFSLSAQPEIEPNTKETLIRASIKIPAWQWPLHFLLRTRYPDLSVNPSGPFWAIMDNDEMERRNASQGRKWGHAASQYKSTHQTTSFMSIMNWFRKGKKRGSTPSLEELQQMQSMAKDQGE
jgi:hypothetical protein